MPPSEPGERSRHDRPFEPHFYGRRRGRRLRSAREEALCIELPARSIELSGEGVVDPFGLFAQPVDSCWLEIGFGGGEHLIGQASCHPAVGLIGCDPYLDGVASLVATAAARRIENLRIFPDDARRLIGRLPDGVIARIFLLFPDPWPKRRHHRRRFVGASTVRELARILVDGGELMFVSDHPDYVRWTLALVLDSQAFDWPARRPSDWRRPATGWIGTRYEKKALASGEAITYLSFRRRSRESGARLS